MSGKGFAFFRWCSELSRFYFFHAYWHEKHGGQGWGCRLCQEKWTELNARSAGESQ